MSAARPRPGGEYTSGKLVTKLLPEGLAQSARNCFSDLTRGPNSGGRRLGEACVYWDVPASGCLSDEAHLSAQKAQASAYPRLPSTHVHAWRTGDPQAPAGQGSQAPDGMTAQPPARPRSGRARLSRSGDFDRVIRRGRSHASRELVLYVFPRSGEGETRLGLSVSRKVGGAVQRNRVKRLLREAFAQEQNALPNGTDVVVVARQEAGPLAEREGLAGIQGVLATLIGQVREGSPA